MEFHHTVTTLDRFQHAHQQIWSQKSELHFYFVLFCCFCFFVILTDTDWHWTHPAGIVCLIVKKARRAEMWILVTKNQNAASLRAATVWSSPPHLDVYTSVEEVCFFLQPFVVCSGAFFFPAAHDTQHYIHWLLLLWSCGESHCIVNPMKGNWCCMLYATLWSSNLMHVTYYIDMMVPL